MKVIIDRFEGQYAVCEKNNEKMIHIDRNILPKDAKEGDVLIIKDNQIIIDYNETKSRHERIKRLMNDLWE